MYGNASKSDGSIDERDRRLEARYSYDRRGEVSTLAYVVAYGPELATAFLDWFIDAHLHLEAPFDGLGRWEVVHFGAALDAAAHGALWYVVRRTIRGELKPSNVRLTPGLTNTERSARFMAAVDALVKEHGIADGP